MGEIDEILKWAKEQGWIVVVFAAVAFGVGFWLAATGQELVGLTGWHVVVATTVIGAVIGWLVTPAVRGNQNRD